MRQISSEGLRLIQAFEGCKLQAYKDIKGIWTIGYGHTGPEVHDGLVITQREADELLREDLSTAESAVSHCVTVPMNDNEYAALVSLCFNIGVGALHTSTLVKKLNQGLRQVAADCFLDWSKQHQLLPRRRAERDMFLEKIAN